MGKLLFNFFIGSVLRIRGVHNEDFNCKVAEKKLRIIHPFTWIIIPFLFIYNLYDWWIKEFINIIKKDICFY